MIILSLTVMTTLKFSETDGGMVASDWMESSHGSWSQHK